MCRLFLITAKAYQGSFGFKEAEAGQFVGACLFQRSQAPHLHQGVLVCIIDCGVS
ncbi:hypothetical protein F2Q70_00002280 [Brassica cretica]|uniref:Uncharacterized protein n=1 Tax=Brassica cretica TaxID=69181 RepID=A0A8S9IJ44_BRACR|nr:hypothetical protein F2Q70_00002280 [Brassica cretica]